MSGRVRKRRQFMAYRKRTLRTMSPTARKVARLIGEVESATNRLKNLIPELQTLDLDSRALQTTQARYLFKDTDLWGLDCALQHGLQDGYFKDNKAWAEDMRNRINQMREPLFKED